MFAEDAYFGVVEELCAFMRNTKNLKWGNWCGLNLCKITQYY